jgi:predicted HTH transcriptional regulator
VLVLRVSVKVEPAPTIEDIKMIILRELRKKKKVTTAEIRRTFEAPVSEERIRKAIRELMAENMVKKVGRGEYISAVKIKIK